MADIHAIQDFAAPELDIYARLTENQLVNRADPENALFIAESPVVIERALDAGCVPVSFLMVRIVAADPNGLMQKLLGAGLVGLGVYMIFFQGRLHIRMTPVSGLITGALSGVLGGLFCMAGVPMAVYLLSVEEKEDYLATIQTFFAMVAVYSAVLHGASGFLTGRVFQAFLFSLAAVALGAAAGKRIFNRINRETLKKVVYGFMLVSGVFLLAS